MSFSGAILIEIVQNQLYGLPLENAGLEQNKIQFGVVLYGYFMNLCSFLNVLSATHFSSKITQWRAQMKSQYLNENTRANFFLREGQKWIMGFIVIINILLTYSKTFGSIR